MPRRAVALSLLLSSLATAASDGALCFRVDLGRGWPVLRRTTAALTRVREPLHPAYAGKADDVLTIAFGAGETPKPRLEADGWRAVYRLADGEASVQFGRLSPAVLFESEGKQLSLLSAAKYLACVRDGKVAIGQADRKAFGPADEPWLLLWFGDRTPLLGSTVPVDVNDKSGVDKGRLETLAKETLDLPLLVRFEHQPAAAARSSERGLTFSFGDAVGKVAIMPLFGRRVFTPTETEAWANTLPDEVLRACRRWSRVLRDVPIGVRETYGVDTDAGSVTVSQEFTWASFEDDWRSPSVYAAPVPPMLALALGGGVPVTFLRDGQQVKSIDYGFMDRSGEAMAVEGAKAYSYRVDGLGKYLWHGRERRAVAQAARPLQAQLERHVADMVGAGHLAPLLYIYGGIGGTWYSHFYWVGSPELAHALAMAHPYLSKGLQAKVVDYLKSEWNAHPPFTIGNVDYTGGAPRAPYPIPWQDIGAHVGRPRQRDLAYRRQSFFFDLYRAYAYYELTGERPDAAKLRQQARALAQALQSKMDWALMGPVRLHTVRDKQSLRYFSLQGQATYNTWVAGAIGLARLARKFGWTEEEKQAHILSAKLALARVAQARFVPEMHRMGLVRGEAKDDWRTLLHIDETCTIVGWGPLMAGVFQDQELPPFIDLVEEVGLLLGAHAQPACRIYLDYLDYAIPFWYLSEGPKLQATEHRTLPLQHYNGNVLAQFWVLAKKGNAFRRYVDVSRFRGDLYFIQNLVAAIDSYGE